MILLARAGKDLAYVLKFSSLSLHRSWMLVAMTKNLKKEILEILDEVRLTPEERKRISSPKKFEKVVASIKESNDEHVIKLFEHVNQSYCDPWAWYALLGVLAQALFDSRTRGRRPKHDKPPDPILVRDYAKIASEQRKNENAVEVCRRMIERHPKKYGSVPPATLNTWISKAGAVKAFKSSRRRTARKALLKK